jgi:hypothetical protein
MPAKTADEIKSDVLDALLNAKIDTLTHSTLQGLEFSDLEMGEIITRRFFGGNVNAQIARLAEISGIQMKILTQTASQSDMARLQEIAALYEEIQKFKMIF